MTNHLLVLAVCFFLLAATNAFQFPSSIRARPSSIIKNAGFDNPLPTTTTTLHGKLWKRLQIEEDDPAMGTSWYLINCVAGVELDLLNQCRYVCNERGFSKTDVEKFVVPTERHLRSHGDKKKVVDVKVRYPGYVFCKIRLIEDVYEALQELELARSWMGTVNRKGHKKLPPAPLPLNEGEVKRFKGLEEEQELFEDMYGGDYSGRSDTGADLLAQYAGYDVGQMVKILKGNFEGEDGTVRRLKNGQLMVRMFTYGQNFDVWFDPDSVRPLTDLEVMRGMSGPTVPIDQDQFDISIGKKDPPPTMDASGERDNPQRMRSGLLQSAGIAPGRNRREDRVARGERGNQDMFGRTQEDIKREEQNWLEYRERQRVGRQGGERSGDVEEVVPKKKKKDGPHKGKDTWGIVERSSWTGGEYGFDADSEQEEQERKFRTAQMYQDRSQRGGRGRGRGRDQRESYGGRGRGGFDDGRRRDVRDRRPVRTPRDRRDEDNEWITKASDDDSADKEEDFFDSLMSELGDDLSGSGAGGRGARTRGSLRHDSAGPSGAHAAEKRGGGSAEDSFFDDLMSELGGEFDEPSPSPSGRTKGTSDDEDDFFSSLEAELSRSLSDGGLGGGKGLEEKESSDDDDFFASLEKEMGKALDKPPQKDDGAAQDDFFSSLIDDVANELESPAKADEQDNFFSSLIDVAGDLEAPAKRDNAKEDDFFSSLIGDFTGDLKTEAKVDEAKEDDFFSSLTDDVAGDLETEAKSTKAELDEARALAREDDLLSSLADDVAQETSNKQGPPDAYGDLSSLTVPVLKDLLRSKGLKVGGKKAELIERLQSSYS